MKNLFFTLLGALFLCSCQDSLLEIETQQLPDSQQKAKEDQPYLIFTSKNELAEVLYSMKNGEKSVVTRVAKSTIGQASNLPTDSVQFVSLLEANKQKLMSQLTPEQLDSIYNDEDACLIQL